MDKLGVTGVSNCWWRASSQNSLTVICSIIISPSWLSRELLVFASGNQQFQTYNAGNRPVWIISPSLILQAILFASLRQCPLKGLGLRFWTAIAYRSDSFSYMQGSAILSQVWLLVQENSLWWWRDSSLGEGGRGKPLWEKTARLFGKTFQNFVLNSFLKCLQSSQADLTFVLELRLSCSVRDSRIRWLEQ